MKKINLANVIILLSVLVFFVASNIYAQEGLKVDTNGNVGIGKEVPMATLHTSGTTWPIHESYSENPDFVLRTTAAPFESDSMGSIRFHAKDSGGTDTLYSGIFAYLEDNADGSENGAINFRTMNDGALGERMRITSSGNVGIGTTIPRVPLDITYQSSLSWPQTDNNPKSADGIYINNNDPNAKFTGIYFGIDNASVNNARIAAVSHGDGNRATDLAFAVDNGATVVTERMRITSSGKVGIGTDTPHEQLSVSKTSAGSTVVGIELVNPSNTTNTGQRLLFNFNPSGSADNYAAIEAVRDNIVQSGDTHLAFYTRDYTTFSEKMRLTDNGNVGIGTTDPGIYKLYVAGPAYSTGGWSGSDVRWKKNITPLNNSLDKVTKLQGISYDWNTEKYPDQGFEKGTQIGLVAQEVEQIIPELVHTNDNGYKSVSYEKLTAVLVEAVKELKAKNDALSKSLQEVTSKNKAIEKLKSEVKVIKSLKTENENLRVGMKALLSRIEALETNRVLQSYITNMEDKR